MARGPRAAISFGIVACAYAILLLLAMWIPEVRAIELGRGETGLDKLLHATAFLVLAVLLSASFTRLPARGTSPATLAATLFVGISYGVVHEALQSVLPAFAFNPADAYANVTGVVLGALLYHGSAWVWSALGGPA